MGWQTFWQRCLLQTQVWKKLASKTLFLRHFPSEKYHALPSVSFLFTTQIEGEASVPAYHPLPAAQGQAGQHEYMPWCLKSLASCCQGNACWGTVHCLQAEPVSLSPWAKRSSQEARSSEDSYGLEKQPSVSAASTFFFLEIHLITKLLAKSRGRWS